MKSVLFQGIDPKLEGELRGDFKSSLLIRKRIVDVLNQKIDTNRKASVDRTNYDSPSWALEQADRIGYERSIRELISLLTDV